MLVQESSHENGRVLLGIKTDAKPQGEALLAIQG
jgi:hypothetical protein